MLNEKTQQLILEREAQAPFFLYDGTRINQQLDGLLDLSTDAHIYYAIKANPNVEVVKQIISHPAIAGYEIASVGEAKIALKAGEVDLRRGIYTGPAKDETDLQFVMAHNIKCLNLESLVEAYRINNIALAHNKKQDVLVRVNTDLEVHDAQVQLTSPTEPSAFGIDESQIVSTMQRISSLPGLNIRGIHTYAATGILKAGVLVDSVAYAVDLTRRIERETDLRFDTMDVGGGFGVDYEGDARFNVREYQSKLKDLVQNQALHDKNLVLELGRHLVAEAGYFVARVVDIKESRGQKVMILNAGTNAHRRPYALNKNNYPVAIISRNATDLFEGQPSINNEMAHIRGPLCTSADRVQREPRFFEKARIGDLFVMGKAGAYGYSMSHKDFLSNNKTVELYVKE